MNKIAYHWRKAGVVKVGGMILLLAYLSLCFSGTVWAQSVEGTVGDIFRIWRLDRGRGINKDLATPLLAHTEELRNVLLGYVAGSDSAKSQFAQKFAEFRLDKFDECFESALWETIDDFPHLERPLQGLAPTGSYRQALKWKDIDPEKFVKEALGDIDATLFGKGEAAEYCAAKTMHKWVNEIAPGQEINQVLSTSEVTVFPEGGPGWEMSDDFSKQFDRVVKEALPGEEAKRWLEIDYLVRRGEGSAHVVHYDKFGTPTRLEKNMDADSLIKNLDEAMLLATDRVKLIDGFVAHYRNLGQLTLKKKARWAAKTVARMLEQESRVRGYRLQDKKLYQRMEGICKAIDQNDDDLLNRYLGGKMLDDFIPDAESHMKRINYENKKIADEVAFRSLGKKAGSRLGILTRGLMLLGYTYDAVDAYLTAPEGEKFNEIAKRLAGGVAADVVGGYLGGKAASLAGGGLVGGGAGFLAGGIAGAVAYILVTEGWEMTEEGIDNILRGYTVDACVEKFFLVEKDINEFKGMSEKDIRKHIQEQWEEYSQWGAIYLGRPPGELAEKERPIVKERIFQEAIKVQSELKRQSLEAQIKSDIFLQILEQLIARVRSGTITPEEFEKERQRIQGNGDKIEELIEKVNSGKITVEEFEEEFEKEQQRIQENQDKMIEERLEYYPTYKKLLDDLKDPGGKLGLWDLATSYGREEKLREEDSRLYYDMLLEDKKDFEHNFESFNSHARWFWAAYDGAVEDGRNPFLNEDIREYYSRCLKHLRQHLEVLLELEDEETGALLYLSMFRDYEGRKDDLSEFNLKKGQLAEILGFGLQKYEEIKAQFEDMKSRFEKAEAALPPVVIEEIYPTVDETSDTFKGSFMPGEPLGFKMKCIFNRVKEGTFYVIESKVHDPNGELLTSLSTRKEYQKKSDTIIYRGQGTIPEKAEAGTYTLTGKVQVGSYVAEDECSFEVEAPVVIERIYTTADEETDSLKTSFMPGDPICYKIRYRIPEVEQEAETKLTLKVKGPEYSKTWSGSWKAAKGVYTKYASATLPENAKGGTYILTGKVQVGSYVDEKKYRFQVEATPGPCFMCDDYGNCYNWDRDANGCVDFSEATSLDFPLGKFVPSRECPWCSAEDRRRYESEPHF